MKHYKSSAELKRMARGQLLGKYGILIGATLIVSLITFAVTFTLNTIIAFTIGYKQVTGYLVYYAFLFFFQLFLSIFNVGYARLYLNVACNRPYQISDIFYGFQAHPGKAILLTLFQSLIGVVCSIPFCIAAGIYMATRSPFVIVFMVITAIIALALGIFFSLMFSQVFYLLVDLPRYSAWELMKISAKIMKGHKGRLFCLDLSFIGLTLLSICTCNIALLWVTPYMMTTKSYFYLNLMSPEVKPTPEDIPVSETEPIQSIEPESVIEEQQQ